MAMNKENIKASLNYGKGKGYSHMIMVCDTFDYEDYSIFVSEEENIQDYIVKYQNPNQMSKIMEIYNYGIDLEYQLNEHRAWHVTVKETPTTKRNESQKDGLIDMHMHTIYSDGDYEVDELVKKVKEAGIHTFSITDHDNIDSAKKMIDFNDPDLNYIKGVELSAHVDKGRMHILGYDYDINNKKLNDVIEKKHIKTYSFMDAMRGILKRNYGVSLPEEDFNNMFNKKGDIGRPQLALLMMKHGIVSSVDEAFDNYLNGAQKIAKKVIQNPSQEEIIEAIKDANGFVSLAHPVSLKHTVPLGKTVTITDSLKYEYESLKKKLQYLKSIGLDAIEVEHINQTKEYREMLYKLAEELNLLVSGGTDYHGPSVKPNVKLGTGIDNNVKIKHLSLLDKIMIRKRGY